MEVSKVHKKSVHLQTKLFSGLHIQGPCVLKQRGAMVVKASAEIDGAEPEKTTTAPSETKDESLSVEELPLESKLQLILQAKCSGLGLAHHDNYHEYCRLLGRFRVNYQLSVLVNVEGYSEWIRLVAEFTLKSLQSWQVGLMFTTSDNMIQDCSMNYLHIPFLH